MSLSSPLTVIGMVNGMIGGFILILPVNALNAGWVYTLLVVAIIGAFSYYSCYICVVHIGDQKDLDYSMYVHFNKNIFIKILYDLTVFANLLFIGFLYFQLICIQWEGITGSHSIANPIANFFALFILIFILKYFQFGASIMAYGIISIVGYVIFLIWVISTAPKGSHSWEAFGSGQINLAAAMGGAYSIQTFFIPILKRNKNPQKYAFFTLIAYIAGASIYFYIAYVGSFGILNRLSNVASPSTIEDYFPVGEAELTVIEVLYLIHLYSVFPQFTLISKKRLFSIFRLKQTQKGKIPIPQIIYALIFCGICLVIRLINVKINEIVDINGSVIGFFFIYFLPGILHIKCLYFSKGRKITFAQKLALDKQKQQNQSQKQSQQMNQTQDQPFQSKRSQIQYPLQSKKQVKVQLSQYRRSSKLNQIQNMNKIKNIDQPLIQYKKSVVGFDRMDSKAQSAKQTVKPFNYSQYKTQIKKQGDISMVESAFQEYKDDGKQYFVCDNKQCQKPKLLIWQVLELIVLTIMILIGVFILVNGIMTT